MHALKLTSHLEAWPQQLTFLPQAPSGHTHPAPVLHWHAADDDELAPQVPPGHLHTSASHLQLASHLHPSPQHPFSLPHTHLSTGQPQLLPVLHWQEACGALAVPAQTHGEHEQGLAHLEVLGLADIVVEGRVCKVCVGGRWGK